MFEMTCPLPCDASVPSFKTMIVGVWPPKAAILSERVCIGPAECDIGQREQKFPRISKCNSRQTFHEAHAWQKNIHCSISTLYFPTQFAATTISTPAFGRIASSSAAGGIILDGALYNVTLAEINLRYCIRYTADLVDDFSTALTVPRTSSAASRLP